MSLKLYNNPKNSLVLYELEDKLHFLITLYELKKFPRVLMLSGNKGIGKFTIINHFLNYVYAKENYDLKNYIINNETNFYKQYVSEVFQNIIHLSGNNYKNVKIEDVRYLKKTILKSTILKKERFIILDDVQLFNINSLNALLKLIEEPKSNNYFILINNKTKPLIETIYSRSLEVKILLNEEKRVKIIKKLIEKNNLEIFINFNFTNLSPGNFLIFNSICEENKINFEGSFLKNLEILLNLYKKNKNVDLINLIYLLTDYYFYNLKNQKLCSIETIIERKSFTINNINKVILYSLNQYSLINAIHRKLFNE